jgi:simple sugar transport system ATP-binding protein
VIAVEGSGESELLRLLAGRLAPTRGTVRIPDIVGFIPADRKRDALIPSLSLTENFALANAGRRRGLMDWTAMRLNTRRALTEFDVRARDPAQPAAELSGGNQQRFVFARERAIAPHALVAENPARGLDIRAAGRVRDEIRAAREAGAAIVFHSSNVDEVLAVATRVVACYAGRVREVEPPLDPGDRTPYTRALMGLA